MCLTICALPVTHTNVCFDRRKKCRKKCNRVLLPTLCVCVCSSSGIQKRLEMIRSDVCFKPVTSVLFTAVRCPVYRCPTLKPGILKKQKIYLQINIDSSSSLCISSFEFGDRGGQFALLLCSNVSVIIVSKQI